MIRFVLIATVAVILWSLVRGYLAHQRSLERRRPEEPDPLQQKGGSPVGRSSGETEERPKQQARDARFRDL